eukprot:6106186-Pyramimonas_sp.AAC.1
MSNMVYQGTVFGPGLWNPYYADTHKAIAQAGYQESKLHKWGRANGVVFDPQKEHEVIVSHVAPVGDLFKILGIDAISSCACEG